MHSPSPATPPTAEFPALREHSGGGGLRPVEVYAVQVQWNQATILSVPVALLRENTAPIQPLLRYVHTRTLGNCSAWSYGAAVFWNYGLNEIGWVFNYLVMELWWVWISRINSTLSIDCSVWIYITRTCTISNACAFVKGVHHPEVSI